MRQAEESRLDDAGWANSRMRELSERKEELETLLVSACRPAEVPKLDVATVVSYSRSFSDLMKHGTSQERRELVRCFVQDISRMHGIIHALTIQRQLTRLKWHLHETRHTRPS